MGEKVWREAVRFMPENWVRSYDTLCDRVFGEGKGISSPMGKRKEVPIGQVNGPVSEVQLSGAAMDYKKMVDRKLRALGREIEYWLESRGVERAEVEKRHGLRCGGCGRFMEGGWKWCAWCGKKCGRSQDDMIDK